MERANTGPVSPSAALKRPQQHPQQRHGRRDSHSRAELCCCFSPLASSNHAVETHTSPFRSFAPPALFKFSSAFVWTSHLPHTTLHIDTGHFTSPPSNRKGSHSLSDLPLQLFHESFMGCLSLRRTCYVSPTSSPLHVRLPNLHQARSQKRFRTTT